MNSDLSLNEWAALESFRVGNRRALEELPMEGFRRVTEKLSWGELLELGTLRQQECAHGKKAVEGHVRGNLQVSRCADCGLLLTVSPGR